MERVRDVGGGLELKVAHACEEPDCSGVMCTHTPLSARGGQTEQEATSVERRRGSVCGITYRST